MKKDLLLDEFKKNPSHAYAISGDLSKRNAWIRSFIDLLNINASDLFFLESSDKIKIQEIRDLQHQIGLKPHSSKYKVAVIANAEMLTLEASNALLKTLEEPPQNSIIILSVCREEDLLLTITSRTRKIKICADSIELITPEKKELINSIFKMTIKEKFDLAQKLSKNEQAEDFVNNLVIILREKMLIGEISIDTINMIQNYRKNFKNNASKRIILENIFLEIS